MTRTNPPDPTRRRPWCWPGSSPPLPCGPSPPTTSRTRWSTRCWPRRRCTRFPPTSPRCRHRPSAPPSARPAVGRGRGDRRCRRASRLVVGIGVTRTRGSSRVRVGPHRDRPRRGAGAWSRCTAATRASASRSTRTGSRTLPPGQYYEAWLWSGTRTPVPIGTFSSSGGHVVLVVGRLGEGLPEGHRDRRTRRQGPRAVGSPCPRRDAARELSTRRAVASTSSRPSRDPPYPRRQPGLRMSDTPRGPLDEPPEEPGWWLGEDGKWYAPELAEPTEAVAILSLDDETRIMSAVPPAPATPPTTPRPLRNASPACRRGRGSRSQWCSSSLPPSSSGSRSRATRTTTRPVPTAPRRRRRRRPRSSRRTRRRPTRRRHRPPRRAPSPPSTEPPTTHRAAHDGPTHDGAAEDHTKHRTADDHTTADDLSVGTGSRSEGTYKRGGR